LDLLDGVAMRSYEPIQAEIEHRQMLIAVEEE